MLRDKRILPIQRNMAIGRVVNNSVTIETITLSQHKKFLGIDLVLEPVYTHFGDNCISKLHILNMFSASTLKDTHVIFSYVMHIDNIMLHCLRSRPGNLSTIWRSRQVIVSWRPTMELPGDHWGKLRPFCNIIRTFSERTVFAPWFFGGFSVV
jgi:hypothetical protein